MAGDDRSTPSALNLDTALRDEPYRFGFYAALRRLQTTHPDKPRLGRSLSPSGDPVRLTQKPSLSFAPSTLASYEPHAKGNVSRLTVNFLGLFGPNGPLPLHLTEYAWDQWHNHHDPTIVRFLDIFHHRMLTFFFRAWAGAQPTVDFDNPVDDRFSEFVGALCGFGMETLHERDAMPDLAKRHFAGHLAGFNRHVDGLEALLGGFFELPVRIVEFVGHWLQLPKQSRWHLGASRGTGILGHTIVLGSRVWDCQHKFRIRIGPMNLQTYERLLPEGDSFRRLRDCVRNYVGDEIEWDLNLVLEADEVPRLELGGRGRLGWSTWLLGGPMKRPADELHLRPELYKCT